MAGRVPVTAVYAAGVLLIAWPFARAFTGALGPDPVRTLEQELGLSALQILVVMLAVTPLRRLTGISLVRFRRALGLTALMIVTAHLSVWLFLDVADAGRIWNDIVRRPWITVGMAAFLMMLPLAATSTASAIRRLGAATWRRLHMLTYVLVPLAGVHFVMVRKGWQVEPLLYLAVIALLLALRLERLLPRRRRMRRTRP
ncbi:MAG TPA: sulfoxide reductase heme-binding subunit YedZ [Bryobacterales bacterium]|nr:sulfoxide reductase heme-binding subunit YedZ [Bryobacterales bacterium]